MCLKVASFINWGYNGATNGYLRNRNLNKLLLAVNHHQFHFIIIEFEHIILHPGAYFTNTQFNSFNILISTLLCRFEGDIQLGIISIKVIDELMCFDDLLNWVSVYCEQQWYKN